MHAEPRMSRKNPKVDEFMAKATRWQAEFRKLRAIALESGLTEELKWRLPCYTLDGSNIAIIQGFKEYCALMFFNGALLRDPRGLLVAPGNSQAGRQLRFTNVDEIAEAGPVLRAYIREAIRTEKAGLKVKMKKTADLTVPAEFRRKLDEMPRLKAAFEALTPGRQRAYIYYFSQPKQAQTRESRVQKSLQRIMKGKGLNDP
jgi:uncharacterized protein YdeI (YjbR/CyaY-like superfamily)